MLRQASSRNQRSKGFKVKQALQISLLIAVCIWLLYQVKHSHEKKRALEERNTNSLNKEIENSQADLVKFGRKDLPHFEKTGSVHEVHNNEEEGEEPREEEHETKQEENEDEERRDKRDDDDIDEQDQEKEDEESEQDQEESTEEKDKSSHDEEKDGHDEFESQDHEGGTQEAREENYKRDDASSAVVHDTQATEFEQVVDKVDDDSGVNDSKSNEDSNANGSEHDHSSASSDSSEDGVTKGDDDSNTNGSKHDDSAASSDGSEDGVINDSKGDEDSNANGSKHEDNTASSDGSKDKVIGDNLENKSVEAENVTNNANNLVVGGSASTVSDTHPKDDEPMLTDNPSSNVSADINNILEVESKPDNGSVTNPVPIESTNETEQQSTMVTELLANSTGVEIDNSTVVNASNYNVSLNSAGDRNSTVDNDAHNLENLVGDSVANSTTTAVWATNTTTTAIESEDAAQGESNDTSHPIITEQEKDARTDLSTLPDIQNVVKSTDVELSER